MLTLNLLPEPFKEEYRYEKKKRLVMSLGISLCLIVIVLDALFFSTYLFLRIYQGTFDDGLVALRQSEVALRLAEVKRNTRALNARISFLDKARSEAVSAGPLLEKVARLVEEGVYLRSVSMDASARTVNILGFAETREAVLALEEALSGSDFVAPDSLKSPVKNILKEKDVEFSFTFTLAL
jgi:Tfp pilus assembly protein PilN